MSKLILRTTENRFYCFIRHSSVISQHKINCQLINIGLKCNTGESIIKKNYSKKQKTWDLIFILVHERHKAWFGLKRSDFYITLQSHDCRKATRQQAHIKCPLIWASLFTYTTLQTPKWKTCGKWRVILSSSSVSSITENEKSLWNLMGHLLQWASACRAVKEGATKLGALVHSLPVQSVWTCSSEESEIRAQQPKLKNVIEPC